MKKLVLLFTSVLLLAAQPALAYDFSAVSPSGHTLFYNICGSNVTVTYPGSDEFNPYWEFTKPTGGLIIPDYVTYNGTTYYVTSIGDYAFYNCDGLTFIDIPYSITSIGNFAFALCYNLISVTIPNSVTSIGDWAFENCVGLTSITIPNGVTWIGYNAFSYCYNITSVNIGSSVTAIGYDAFSGCDRLTSIIVSNENTELDSRNNCNAIIQTSTNTLIVGCQNTIIPNSVTSIGDYAFKDCSSLTSVTIPNSVTSIGDMAFYYCGRLTSVTIPNSVTSIGDGAFSHTGITSVTIPNSVTSIGNSAFSNTGITSVTIPNSVTSIGDWAFSNTGITSVTIGSGVTSIGSSVFSSCDSLSLMMFMPVIPPTLANASSICDSTIDIVVPHNSYMAYINAGENYSRHNIFNDSIFISTTVNNTSRGYVVGLDSFFVYPQLPPNEINLIAIPYYGYHFSHWNDGSLSTTRYVHVTRDTTFTAYFDYNQYIITLNVDNNNYGSVNGSGSYDYLSNRTIAATANYGYHFAHWSDGNSDNPRTITLTQDTSFTAYFDKNSYTVSVVSNDTVMGTAWGDTTTLYLDSATISASAHYGYVFSHWNDSNTNNPRMVQVTQNKTYTAYFDYDQFTISLGVDTAIHGTTSGAGIFNYLTLSTISASANYGYHFTHWSDGNTDNPRSFTLTQDTSFTAIFAKNVYTITANSENATMGSVSGNGTHEYLDTISLTATANYGYHFSMWNDGVTDNPRQVQVTRDSVFTAQFDYNQYTISLGVDTAIHGTTSGAGIFNYLTPATISASANYGYHFTSWSDGNTDNPRIISLTQDTSFTAYFEKNSYAVTVLSNNDTMGQAAGGDTVLYLDSITISASANYGYHFTHWQDNNTDNPRTVQVTQNKTYTAYFDYDQFTLTVQSDNTTQGNVSGSGNYNYLSNRTITATPTYGHHFTYWNDGVTENPRTITLTQDTSFTAHFALNQYTLTVSAGEHGTATGSGTYNFGDTISIQATPDDHYHFTRWNDGNRENPRYIRIEEDITLTAFFAIDTHTVSVTTSDIVRGQVEASGTEFVYGTPCTVTATAYTGYVFAGWSNGVTANPYTFAVVSDVELTAIFDSVTVGITDIDANDVSIHVAGGRILVMGAEGMEMRVFDIVGREVVSPTQSGESPVLPRGVYLVKVGTLPAKKVVVM